MCCKRKLLVSQSRQHNTLVYPTRTEREFFLIIPFNFSKGSTIEIHDIKLEEDSLLKKFSIYGTISVLQVLNIPEKDTCALFTLTNQHYFTILTYNEGSIVTLSHGHLDSGCYKVSDVPTSAIILDNMVLVNAFAGCLFTIPFYNVSYKLEMLYDPIFVPYIYILFVCFFVSHFFLCL